MTDNTASTDTTSTDTGAPADTAAEKPKAKRAPRKRHGAKSKGKAWDISQFVVPAEEGKTRFHDFDLPPALMRGIQDTGFHYCTPIQASSLPHSLNGHDMVGKAQTGTGKTAAFLISIITDLIKHPVEDERYMGEARSMIMAPTRELAIQIADDATRLLKHTDLNVHCLVGGMDYGKQLQKMQKSHCDILVGTPGRLLDFANNRDLYLDQVEVLVIDEADRMLDMGFIPQVRRLVRLTPKREERQTLLFSATFTPEVLRLSETWTDSPVTVEIGAERVATDTVDQRIYITTASEKFALLNNILVNDDVDSVMVFANRRDICRNLHEKLKKKGFKVGLLSGDVPQNRRMKALESFKSGALKVMVATDVAGRGIHVDGVSHVINYTLPEEPEDYVHRIGRTGRAGKTGTSISFACEDDAFLLEPIEKLLDMKLACIMPEEHLLQE
ncbi:ATP-dependent RNA helicase RhlB [SAR92 clade bacterium H231]|nr:ATP-dependent RNA helicase RhlB [SAR92 clade bacterium H231]MDA7816152.1 ATP-dependent RNA helicase RhlB [Porticoccaceae bacterium]MDA8885897.1 ATP-dependent RNA helicase RhlB [Porticoccaceae bacterium]MDA8903395.1 ATP-dependent RNA helicase RhlB [Porticoccaceae bacterium]MDB2549555.1 ATP-dependent RNA helicase RhlB [Porticoccaceae bacterium]